MRSACIGVALGVLLSIVPGLAQTAAFPAYLTLPSQVQTKPNGVEEDFGEAEFAVVGVPEHPIERGRHWSAGLTFTGVAEGTDPEVLWAQMKPSLLKGGWTTVSDAAGQAKVARYQKDGHDTWINLWIFNASDLRMDLVEVGPPSLKLTLTKPAAKPETVAAETGDFPYLGPIPGSSGGAGIHDGDPMLIDVDLDKTTSEKQVVGSGSITKSYTLPPRLASTILFVTVYRQALTAAGWTIAHQTQGPNAADAVLAAHYNANGRDIWAYLHSNGGNYTIQVADPGTEDIGKELDQDCHVALYGIHFDFNKSTLRPDSDPVLQKVLGLLKSRADLSLEVQGHTDNVGSEDYNQKLSDARAKAVVDWLLTNGTASNRLTATGYGMKMPIADNGSDEGRAKNRRVELKKQGCAKQSARVPLATLMKTGRLLSRL